MSNMTKSIELRPWTGDTELMSPYCVLCSRVSAIGDEDGVRVVVLPSSSWFEIYIDGEAHGELVCDECHATPPEALGKQLQAWRDTPVGSAGGSWVSSARQDDSQPGDQRVTPEDCDEDPPF